MTPEEAALRRDALISNTPATLFDTSDAQAWAERFVFRVAADPSIATDVGTMTAWFAGAMQTGARPDVKGTCPACGHTSLFLGRGGHVTCAALECPDPGAAADVLMLDHRHIVELGDHGWSVEHPATCRTKGRRLLDCPVHVLVEESCEMGPPARLGRYHVARTKDGHLWWSERLEMESRA